MIRFDLLLNKINYKRKLFNYITAHHELYQATIKLKTKKRYSDQLKNYTICP